MAATKFWKVIVIQLDLFESTIIDERHFSNKEEAKTFESKYAKNDSIITSEKQTYVRVSLDKNGRSTYTDTYRNKKTHPQTVLAHLGRVLHNLIA